MMVMHIQHYLLEKNEFFFFLKKFHKQILLVIVDTLLYTGSNNIAYRVYFELDNIKINNNSKTKVNNITSCAYFCVSSYLSI